jgi:EF-P beta-lysylation protein EpmB
MGLKHSSLTRRTVGCQEERWQRELASAFTRPAELLKFLRLDPRFLPAAQAAADSFRLLVPRGYAELMAPGDPHDPLLLQVLPVAEELDTPDGFVLDPVGDLDAVQAPGLLRKYQARALLVLTGACAIHCRYCFRRHFPYSGYGTLRARAAAAVTHIAEDRGMREVILSGGDPLMLDDALLADLVCELDGIPHLKRLRLHTRLPVVLPARVTDSLCRILAASRLDTVVVLQVNHARELGGTCGPALRKLSDAGALLLNQSVLLRRVNDDAGALADLSEALFANGVLPYYLHLLDRVSGAAHFEVTEASAATLMDRLHRMLPGYLVPRLVREQEGEPYKVPLPPG